MCGGSCFRKLEDRRTVINLGFINYYRIYRLYDEDGFRFLLSPFVGLCIGHHGRS